MTDKVARERDIVGASMLPFIINAKVRNLFGQFSYYINKKEQSNHHI